VICVNSVKEEPIEGYESIVTGNVEEGFVITNIEVKDPPKETSEPKEEEETLVETTDKTLLKTATTNYTLMLIVLLSIILGTIPFTVSRKILVK